MLAEQVLLSRIQFAFTAGYHFIFVPITIGVGLLMAIFVTWAYRTKSPADEALSRMWVKIFTATFAIGVATGITMEFSFGTNWANYSRFVGDIFGAPLAAEALFAFFLESVFLGILLFGRNKIKPILYVISSWLTFAGSALSALWILIANSWMQTPAGAELSADGSQALITDFFAAAFNPSTLPRYTHTVLALLVMGAFVAIAIGAWYMLKKRHEDAARKMVRTGTIVACISTVLLLVAAHASAVEVWEEQPTKLAMMEGIYNTEVPELSVGGFVDEESEEAVTIAIPGGTSFLATGTWDTEYPGLNELAATEQFEDVVVEAMPTNFVFQVYHIMVAMFGLIVLVLILALIFSRKNAKKSIKDMKGLQWILIISPILPFLAIQTGWLTAEVGRQPYVVYPSNSGPEGVYMTTDMGTSVSVQPFELVITLILFFAVYILLFIGWARVLKKFVGEGPVEPSDEARDAEAERLTTFSIAGNTDDNASTDEASGGMCKGFAHHDPESNTQDDSSAEGGDAK